MLDNIRIQEIEQMDLKVKEEECCWEILNPNAMPKTKSKGKELDQRVAVIFKSGYSMDTAYRNFDELDKQRKERLFKMLVDWSEELFKRNRKDWE